MRKSRIDNNCLCLESASVFIGLRFHPRVCTLTHTYVSDTNVSHVYVIISVSVYLDMFIQFFDSILAYVNVPLTK